MTMVLSSDGLAAQLLVAGAALLVAVGIIVSLSRIISPRHRTARTLIREAEREAAFLFDDEALVDATPAGRKLLRLAELRGSDFAALMEILKPQFPDLADQLRALASKGVLSVAAQDGSSTLEAELWDGLARLVLRDAADTGAALAVSAMEQELLTLRAIAEDAPQLIWKEDAAGQVTWANRAYLAICDAMRPVADGADPVWPPARVFGERPPASDSEGPSVQRQGIPVPGRDGLQWFEVTRIRRADGLVCFAIDANGVVQAEHAQRNFVQTLTKTFAHLSTGLAIFDRQRRLVLFNPAFLDLTGLPVTFLSSRPVVHSVLDRLRDINMLPEPRHYASWRDQVAALEVAATEGSYCENWSLPGGQTFRVTGRPHPDGAIAFLFEDITSEVSLTRNFRSELRTAQAILDNIAEAVAVFSATGTLTISNSHYHELWNDKRSPDGNDGLGEVGIASELQRWQAQTVPTPIWGDVRDFVGAFGERAEWRVNVLLQDGRSVECRFVPLPGGATLVGFRIDMRAGRRPDLRTGTNAQLRDKILAEPLTTTATKPAKPPRNRVTGASAAKAKSARA